MTLTEKMAYIRGLADGLKLDANNDEVKVIKSLINFMDSVTAEINELKKAVAESNEHIDSVDEDLATLEDDFDDLLYELDEEFGYIDDDEDDDYDDEDCDDCDESDFDMDDDLYSFDDEDDEEFDDFDDEEEADDFDDLDVDDSDSDEFFEITCPSCDEKIYVSEEVLLEGEIKCPNCGENLEFDFSDSDIEYDESNDMEAEN